MGDFTQTLLSINYAMDLLTAGVFAGALGFFYWRPNIQEVVTKAATVTVQQTIKQVQTDSDKIVHPKNAGDFFEGLGGYVNNVMNMTNGGFVLEMAGNTGKGLW